MELPMCATSCLAPREDGKIACDYTWLSDSMARCGSRFAKQQSVTSAQRDPLNTIQEAGDLTRGCARAVSAVPRTFCLLLGLLCTASPGQAAGFNFASLQSLLAQQDIGSVEELIAALPPAQRNRYALVFDSRSLQGASLENPRVILYGPDARFIVTFNGSPAQRGFRVVETMEFDAATKEFRLRELLFPERAGGVDKVVVSEADPQRCGRRRGRCGTHSHYGRALTASATVTTCRRVSAPACRPSSRSSRRTHAIVSCSARTALPTRRPFARTRSASTPAYRRSHPTPSSPFT